MQLGFMGDNEDTMNVFKRTSSYLFRIFCLDFFSSQARCIENLDFFFGQLRIFFLYGNDAQFFPYDFHLSIIKVLRGEQQRIFDL